MQISIPLGSHYARLPERLFARLAPRPVGAPRLLQLNDALALELGLDPAALASPEGVRFMAGNLVPEGAEPVALAYAGHQFGHFNPQLGDGRAILLGELVDRDGQLRDVQLKGSGPTPWSRGGDGRAAVGPVLREFLVSEAMAAMGIPTTRALAAVATGEAVYREAVLPGAVLTRIAASHLRVGTFQYFAAREDVEALSVLTAFALARHYPAAEGARGLLAGVVARQAELVARWMLVGFIHGVMNTDNCAISGETIDYGPCAFLDAYHPDAVFSSIDHAGRYGYSQQPRIAQWNCARLAEALLPLLAADEGTDEDGAMAIAQEVLGGFADRFNSAWLGGLGRKLGLGAPRAGDEVLVRDFLALMAGAEADFTLTFRQMADAALGELDGLRAVFGAAPGLDEWLARWQARLAAEPMADRRAAMLAVNPAVIPRNHLLEAALEDAVQRDDLSAFEALLAVVRHPFETPADPRFTLPAPDGLAGYQTFCGT